jgi:hypothetical protein
MRGLRIADCGLRSGGGGVFRRERPILNTRTPEHLNTWLLLLALLVLAAHPAAAQSQADLERMGRELAAAHPKRVEVCFDVSGSMENLGKFGPLREALIPLLRGGLKAGDQVVITAFDTEPRELFSRTLKDDAEVDDAINALPSETTPNKTGTNIRWPHHLALKAAEKEHMPASFILLVSDSYNDTPSRSDRAWPDYLKYYRLDSHGIGQLTVFPDTPENHDYERLMRREKALNIRTWGIGVEMYPPGSLATSNRPHEQRSLVPEMKNPPAAAAPAPTEVPAKPAVPSLLWLWIALGLLALIAIMVWLNMNRPVHVSLSEGPKRYQNYTLRPREAVVLGGAAARGDPLGYPVAGTREPAGYLERGVRDFRLRPGEGARAGEATLLLNNEAVEGPRRIDYSDDIKIRLQRPATEGAPSPEVRLQFGRALGDDAA